MKGFIEYLIASIEEVEKEFEQDIKKEIEENKTSDEILKEIMMII
jgi:hypothetical protein